MGIVTGDDDALIRALGGELYGTRRVLTALGALLTVKVRIGGEATAILPGAEGLEHAFREFGQEVRMRASDCGKMLVGGGGGEGLLRGAGRMRRADGAARRVQATSAGRLGWERGR